MSNERTISFKSPAGASFGAPSRSALHEPTGYVNAAGGGAYRDANAGFWGASTAEVFVRQSSPDREINRNRSQGVANARVVDRNNPYINAGITKRAINAVGAALQLQYLPNWTALGLDGKSETAKTFVQQIENAFSLWGDDPRFLCDAQRQGNFGSMMLLAFRECFGVEGEALVISRYDEDRQAKYRGKFASFIEVLSADRLSTPTDRIDGRGPRIVAGKELDEYGAAVAYHVLREEDPTDGTQRWDRVPRETEWGRPVGIHYFMRHRAGQQRNMPAIIQSLRSVKMLDKFDDAELEASVINAILSIFIESPGTTEEVLARLQTMAPAGSGSVFETAWEKRFEYYAENTLTAGGVRIPVLPPGDKIQMNTASRANANSKDFRSAFLRSMAAQLNLTYEQFTGDYSETTFSSARAAMIDVWRLITVDRILFTSHVALQIFVGFMEEVWVRGEEIGVDWPADWPDFYENLTAYTQCEFRGPGMGWVDPEKDAKASKLRQEQGLTSPTYEASQQGQIYTDVIDQIAADHEYARSKGVVIPGMPEYADLQARARQGAPEDNVTGDSEGDRPAEENRDADGKFGEKPDAPKKKEPPRDEEEAMASEGIEA